jgi:DNA mismatch repair protein MutH
MVRYTECDEKDKYDDSNPKNIEDYGKKMIGHTFRELYETAKDGEILRFVNAVRESGYDYAETHARPEFKGGMGNLVEECYFGYKANSHAEADFTEAGVELKVTPYKRVKKGFSAKERLVLTMINYFDVAKETTFEISHLWMKIKLMLLVWYLHENGVNDIDATVDYVQLFTPPADDLEIIKGDYKKIVDKIKDGRAHELSEGDTMYLGACTKGAKGSDRREQPFSVTLAKPRAFSFKNSYMTYILNQYIRPGKVTYEPILRASDGLTDFEDYVMCKIDRYQQLSLLELCKLFAISEKQRKAKNLEAMLAFRMLGIKGNHAEEFEKAGIVVKTIRIDENGKIKENMSFPCFNFVDLSAEEWENSIFGDYLRETRFFFVVYRKDFSGMLHLCGSQFWNIPYADLEGDVRTVWESTRDIVREGRMAIHIDAKGTVTNNFPKQSQNRVAHVRPHGRNREDTYPLPEGTCLQVTQGGVYGWVDDTRYTKQSFWLNNSYILSQLNRRFLLK